MKHAKKFSSIVYLEKECHMGSWDEIKGKTFIPKAFS